MGGLLLFAAVIAWGTGNHDEPARRAGRSGTEHVRTVVVMFIRNSAIGTLVLSALSAWLLFPARRPKMAGAGLGADRPDRASGRYQPLPADLARSLSG